MGLTMGVAAIANGYIQAQMTMFATAFIGSKQGLAVRFDMAVGEEGSSMWVMIKHPF